MLIQRLAKIIFERKGSQITAVDVRGISPIADYILIANGNVERHVLALAKEVEKELKQEGIDPHHIEGKESGDWVILDCFDLMIHFFTPPMRQKYQLDCLWPNGKVIPIDLSSPSSVQVIQQSRVL